MSHWIIVSGVTFLYLGLVLVLGIRARSGLSASSLEGYLAEGRSLGFIILFFIMGAELFSAFAFLGAPGWAYSKGAPALYILGYVPLALVPWWVLGPKVARLGFRHGYLTQAELVADRFQSTLLSGIMALVSVAVMLAYLTSQIIGAGLLFEASTAGHVPFWLGALLAFLVVAVYVFVGGLRGIGFTNVFQGTIMVAAAWVIGIAIPFRFYGGVGAMFREIAERAPEYLTIPGYGNAMSWAAFSSAIVVSLLGLPMWPHFFNRAYGARDETAIKRAIILYPLYGLLLVPILIIGFAGILLEPNLEVPDRIVLALVARARFSPYFVGLLLSGALAAAMSTGANLAHTSASVIVRDFYVSLFRPDSDERRLVMLTKLLVIGTCTAAYCIALNPPASIIGLVLVAFGGLVQFFPILVGVFYWKRATREGALAGLVGGVLVVLYFTFLSPSPGDIHAGVWGLLVNVALFAAVSWTTTPMDSAHVERFVEGSKLPIGDTLAGQEGRASHPSA
ncbi:MAG: sodium:solute symporter [Acidobacteriota bacterium]